MKAIPYMESPEDYRDPLQRNTFIAGALSLGSSAGNCWWDRDREATQVPPS